MMATPAMPTTPPTASGVNGDTLVIIKVLYAGQNRRFKLALRDLGAQSLPQKLRVLLAIPESTEILLERYSDSAGTYVTLDSTNSSVYKQLYRAAKAKLKLRLKATTMPLNKTPVDLLDDKATDFEKTQYTGIKSEPRASYLDTVLSQPLASGLPRNPRPFELLPDLKPLTSSKVKEAVMTPQEPTRSSQSTARMPGAFCSADPYSEPTGRVYRSTAPCFGDYTGTFSIDCNSCNKSIPNEHYHCSICEKGDFDLCQKCIDNGTTCNGDDHWLIKRFIRNGIIIPSVTETCAPRKAKQEKPSMHIPGIADYEERTCNSCLIQLPASAFVTCKDCDDFDLCQTCFLENNHGHALAHEFEPVNPFLHHTVNQKIKSLCQQARGLVHQATCDGCNKQIIGVRNKCLSCPDFDYCSACYVNAKTSHAGHRFAALYEPLTYVPGSKEHHRGIFCDGPLCNNSGYIRGDRYKCAVCDDTDFCANCEALPSNTHNKTHPLIKIKVPIRHVEISTFNQVDDEHETVRLGDRRVAKHASTETVRTTSANAATQVQTVAEVCPADDSASSTTTLKAADSEKHVPGELQAWYESDSTPDGTRFAPNRFVSQSWTLRNPGPETWPAGCAVYFVGGDDMRNLDMLHPSSVSAIAKANQSTMLEEPLEPGKTAVFTVLVKSPLREGRCISYWRVKTPDGTPFGHKLWIDIMVHETSVDLPIRTGPVGESKKATVTDEEDEEQKGSTMIFPKLEKESPVSSIHDVTESAVPQAPSVKSEEHDLLDDVESLELEEESDDGFLTDEEYDVLDASDEDFLEAQATIGGK